MEFVAAFSVVLAMGLTRSWLAAVLATIAAIAALTAATGVAGFTLVDRVSQSLLQLVIGTL